jgi:hypothetical protein
MHVSSATSQLSTRSTQTGGGSSMTQGTFMVNSACTTAEAAQLKTLDNRGASSKRSILVALVCAVAGLCSAYVGYMVLGVATGVVAMCSWGPEWWAKAYFAGFFLLPAAAAWAGIRGRRWYLRRRTESVV